ncbi:MAG TPA: cytochrome c [Candidatus Kapabacteria bacterium]|nr:cytochrome c [Candidatus Kapabacteria bacterium]
MKITTTNILSILALSAFLIGCGGSGDGGNEGDKAPEAGIAKGDAAHGQQLYVQNCASCHGTTGKGDGPAAAALNPKPADHSNKAVIAARTDEELSNIIKMGGGVVGKPTMPAFPQFSEKDLNDLVAHLRDLSGSDHR